MVFSDEERETRRKESMEKYLASPKGKIAIDKLNNSENAKTSRKKYELSSKGHDRQKIYRDKLRLIVLKHYSKTLSNSNIPCCNCCGENFHIDFLAVDHVMGKLQMNFEPNLVKLGYSSKLTPRALPLWIINNNFPNGFQILCSNCNFAKGMIKNNNKCPHENNIERKS